MSDDPAEVRALLAEAAGHVDAQLAIVDARRTELGQLAARLADKRARIEARLAEFTVDGARAG